MIPKKLSTFQDFFNRFFHSNVQNLLKDVFNQICWIFCKNNYFNKIIFFIEFFLIKCLSLESKKKLPNKKILKSAKFEAKEQFTQSALENLTKENDLLIKNLKKAGEINEEVA